MFVTLELPRKTSGAVVRWVYWNMMIGTLEIDFCKIGIWLNIRYCLFNSYVRKVVRRGIGIDIGVLWSATIMNEPDFVSVWLRDSP